MQWKRSEAQRPKLNSIQCDESNLIQTSCQMAERAKRRRLNDASNGPSILEGPRVFPHSPSAPATADDKQNWNGFCEIESEPVSEHDITQLQRRSLKTFLTSHRFLRPSSMSSLKISESRVLRCKRWFPWMTRCWSFFRMSLGSHRFRHIGPYRYKY